MELEKFDFSDGTVDRHAGFYEIYTVQVLNSKVFSGLDTNLILCSINARILVS